MSINYSAYYQKGYTVLPEIDKKPQADGEYIKWGIYYKQNHKPDAETLLSWNLLDDHDIGLLTGECSHIIGLDFDYASKDEIGNAIRLLGDSPVKKYGTKGVTIFYRYNGERNEIWQKDGKVLCELLSSGRKTTIPPSKCKNKRGKYYWEKQDLLDIDDLPSLPDGYSDKLCSLFSIKRPVYNDYPKADYDTKPTHSEAVEVLNYCDPNCSRADWVKIGMSFRNEVGDAAFHDFDDWSSRGKSYDKATIRSQWRSFNGHSITYGTLVYYAKQGGYRPPERAPIVHESVPAEDLTQARLMAYAKKIEESEAVPEIVANAPKIIKEMAYWIYSTAYYSQPMLSLGASLATIGFLMGRDYACAGSGLKANLYNICIAGTQENKEHIEERCQQIMEAFGLLNNYRTAWTSGSAIENALDQTDGQVLYVTDEAGIMMNALVGKYTNAMQQEAVSIILRLYTKKFYKGKDYAASAEKKPLIIKNPFVSICGFTQREPFFEAMGSMQAYTGVLNRMCLFKAPEIRPLRNKLHDIENLKMIPSDLMAELSQLSESIDYLRVGKTHKSVVKYVPYTSGALKLLDQIKDDIDERFRRSQLEGENIHLLIGRNPEVVQKVALIASGGKVIDEEILSWAKAVVDYSTGIMCEASASIVDNENERKKFKFVEFLQKRGGSATLTEIGNNFKLFSSRHEKQQIIEDLRDAGKIEPRGIGRATVYHLT